MVLDLQTEAGFERLLTLIDSVDLLIDGREPGAREVNGLEPDVLLQRKPDMTLLSISDFGLSGPYRDYVATHAVHAAMAGMPGLPPLLPPGALCWETAAIQAAFVALLGHWQRLGLLVKDQGRWHGTPLIGRDLIAQMLMPSVTNPNYGCQIWLGTNYEPTRHYNSEKTGPGFRASEPFAVADMVYFDGFGGQRVYISRSRDLVVVRLGEARIDWDDTHLPNLILSELPDTQSSP